MRCSTLAVVVLVLVLSAPADTTGGNVRLLLDEANLPWSYQQQLYALVEWALAYRAQESPSSPLPVLLSSHDNISSTAVTIDATWTPIARSSEGTAEALVIIVQAASPHSACAKSVNGGPACLLPGLPTNTMLQKTFSALLKLQWDTVVLASSRLCNWGDLDGLLRAAILREAGRAKIEILANPFSAFENTCARLPIAQHRIILLLPQSLEDGIEALKNIFSRTLLAPGYVVVYLADLTPVPLTVFMGELERREETALANRLRQILVELSTFPGSTEFLKGVALLYPELASSGLLQQVASDSFAARVFQAALAAGAALASATQLETGALRFSNSWMLADHFPALHMDLAAVPWAAPPVFNTSRLHLLRLGASEDEVLRVTFSAQATTFFDRLGRPLWRPLLLLGDNAEMHPPAKFPIQLKLMILTTMHSAASSLSAPATHAFTVAALEYFGVVFTEIRIATNQTDTRQANCSALALAAARDHYHAIIGTTTSDCALEVARMAARQPRLPFVGPGSFVPALSRPDLFPTSFRMSPPAEYLGMLLAALLDKLGFYCAVLLTDETSIDYQAARDGFTRAALERNIVLFGIMGFSDSSGEEAFVDTLLDKLWSLGTGVIVVNLNPTQATLLFEVARRKNMLENSFLWVLNADSVTKWPTEVAERLNEHMLTPKPLPPVYTGPLSADFFTFFSSTVHQGFREQSLALPAPISFAEAINAVSTAARLNINAYQFSSNITAAREAILSGLRAFDKAHPLESLAHPQRYFDANHDGPRLGSVMVLRNGQLQEIGSIVGDQCTVNTTLWPEFQLHSCTAPARRTSVVDDSRKNSQNLLIIITLALLATLALAILTACRWGQHRRSVEEPYDFTEELKRIAGMTLDRDIVTPSHIRHHHVRLGTELGEGEFGRVHKAVLLDSSLRSTQTVAAKVSKALRAELSGHSNLSMFYEEAVILAQFAHHTNIVKLIGVVSTGPRVMVIMEYCRYGSLKGCLRERFLEDRQFPWSEKLRMAGEIADGMNCVSLSGGLHMDLAARNVLVAEGFVCKIADFGMAKDTNYYVASSNRLVPIRWAAPEVLRQRVFSTASDVWSFGILLWELATNAASLPYASMGNSAAIMSVLSGYRLEKPSGCPGAVYRVMLECWAERARRPTFAQLMTMLKRLLETYLEAEPGDSDDEGVVAEPSNVNEALSSGAETRLYSHPSTTVSSSYARQTGDSNYAGISGSIESPYTAEPPPPRPVTYATMPRVYAPPATYGQLWTSSSDPSQPYTGDPGGALRAPRVPSGPPLEQQLYQRNTIPFWMLYDVTSQSPEAGVPPRIPPQPVTVPSLLPAATYPPPQFGPPPTGLGAYPWSGPTPLEMHPPTSSGHPAALASGPQGPPGVAPPRRGSQPQVQNRYISLAAAAAMVLGRGDTGHTAL